MGRTDKILLVILIILLPMGIFISRQLFEPAKEELSDQRLEQLAKIEQLLDKIAENGSTPETVEIKEEKTLIITSVSMASSSGILRIEGSAKSVNSAVMIDSVVLGNEANSNTNLAVKDANSIGKDVSRVAVKTDSMGKFSYDYLSDEAVGTIEMRIVQGEQVAEVRFDLQLQKRL